MRNKIVHEIISWGTAGLIVFAGEEIVVGLNIHRFPTLHDFWYGSIPTNMFGFSGFGLITLAFALPYKKYIEGRPQATVLYIICYLMSCIIIGLLNR